MATSALRVQPQDAPAYERCGNEQRRDVAEPPPAWCAHAAFRSFEASVKSVHSLHPACATALTRTLWYIASVLAFGCTPSTLISNSLQRR